MNKNIQTGVVAAVVAVVVSLLLSFTGVGKVVGGTFVSEQTFGGGLKTAYTNVFGGKLIDATKTLTANELRQASFFPVGKASGSIILTLPAVTSDFVGREVVFATTVASTAVSMSTTSTMDVVTMAVNGTNSTLEDVGDYIKCMFTATSKATCLFNAKD